MDQLGGYSSHGSMNEQMGVRSIEWLFPREDKNRTWWIDYAVCMPYKSNKGIRAHEMKEETPVRDGAGKDSYLSSLLLPLSSRGGK